MGSEILRDVYNRFKAGEDFLTRLHREPSLPIIENGMVERLDSVPEWWTRNGNRKFSFADRVLPSINLHGGLPEPTNSLIVLGKNSLVAPILVWGGTDRRLSLAITQDFAALGYTVEINQP